MGRKSSRRHGLRKTKTAADRLSATASLVNLLGGFYRLIRTLHEDGWW